MSTVRSLSRSRAWLRVLVVLLALLMPGAAAELSPTPVAAADTVEYDVHDSALRPAPCVHRPAAPLRPAPLPAPADRPLPAPPGLSYALHALRTVVLRC